MKRRESWWTLWVRDFDLLASIASSDVEFARWRASVNEAASPPAQNPGGLLLEELNPIPAPGDQHRRNHADALRQVRAVKEKPPAAAVLAMMQRPAVTASPFPAV